MTNTPPSCGSREAIERPTAAIGRLELQTVMVERFNPDNKLSADLRSLLAYVAKLETERDALKLRNGQLHTEFWEVEKERQAVCLAVKHHSNSGRPVSDVVRELLAEAQRLREGRHDEIVAAFGAGCLAVHENYQPDPDPSFTEAAQDYAATLTLTEGR